MSIIFKHFHLFLTHLFNFNQTWQKVSLGEGIKVCSNSNTIVISNINNIFCVHLELKNELPIHVTRIIYLRAEFPYHVFFYLNNRARFLYLHCLIKISLFYKWYL